MMMWNFREKVSNFLRPGIRILDMWAGDGEFLLELHHPVSLLTALEWREPAFSICKKRLENLGGQVFRWRNGPLPLDDGSFDLVINHCAPLDGGEVARVLCPGGFLVAEQVGSGENPSLGLNYKLENIAPQLENAGFCLNYVNQFYDDEQTRHRFIIIGKRQKRRNICDGL